ncbi:ESPR-type extended signal peptide-containing protein, partial [Duodenibacillus massiliensis]|uniref:ESPR-type extended signal peptide-containing protein n=1 Tax=Duodenibacillus massiliensis TaxID=1852381 RepID=UPI003077BF8D
MNKSFKVVFSKARSALMVVNEATSSIQAKGTKTVIAAAAAAMIAGGAVAATTSIVKDAATLKDGTVYDSYTSDKASRDNDFGALYVDGKGATPAVSGSAVNLSFTNNTSSGKAGALALDSASLTLTDAQFSNNSAAGFGGAVRLWGTSASPSTLTLTTKRDLTYAGNKAGQGKTAVSGATALGARYEDMGGFAHLQGNSTLTLTADANTTLTIGETGAAQTAGLDSITTTGSNNNLVINGEGTVNLNGSLEGFVGNITVSNGTVNMATGFGSIDNTTQSRANNDFKNNKAGDVQSFLTVSGATVN